MPEIITQTVSLDPGSRWRDEVGTPCRVIGSSRDIRTQQERVVIRWTGGPRAGTIDIPPLEEFGRRFKLDAPAAAMPAEKVAGHPEGPGY